MTTKTCQRCGNTFSLDSQKSAKQRLEQKFCSRECWRKSLFKQVERTCERCGKAFSVRQALAKARFCSWECRSTVRDYPCAYCGGTYRVKACNAPKRNTCSRRCAALLRAAEGRTPNQGRLRSEQEKINVSLGLQRYYGGDPTKHPNFKGGPVASRSGGWNLQRKLARQRDHHTCQACLKTAEQVGRKNLPVHHIIPYREFKDPKEANQLENLITLCQSCHIKMERGKLFLIRQPRDLAASGLLQ